MEKFVQLFASVFAGVVFVVGATFILKKMAEDKHRADESTLGLERAVLKSSVVESDAAVEVASVVIDYNELPEYSRTCGCVIVDIKPTSSHYQAFTFKRWKLKTVPGEGKMIFVNFTGRSLDAHVRGERELIDLTVAEIEPDWVVASYYVSKKRGFKQTMIPDVGHVALAKK